ncbi:MAG: SRPBCC family protein [Pseudomonadota bacterium]
MYNVTVARTLNAPLDAVWESWADFGNVAVWHPLVAHSKLLGDPAEAVQVGSRRQCDLADGKNWVREEIVEMQQDRRIGIKLYEGTMPLKTALATVAFGTPDAARTRVHLSMDFEPKFGLLGRLMAPMIKRQFKRMFAEILATNERHVSGASDGANDKPVAAPAVDGQLLAGR